MDFSISIPFVGVNLNVRIEKGLKNLGKKKLHLDGGCIEKWNYRQIVEKEARERKEQDYRRFEINM